MSKLETFEIDPSDPHQTLTDDRLEVHMGLCKPWENLPEGWVKPEGAVEARPASLEQALRERS